MSETRNNLDFRKLSCIPIPDNPDFRLCLKSDQRLSEIQTKIYLLLFFTSLIKIKFHDTKFSK